MTINQLESKYAELKLDWQELIMASVAVLRPPKRMRLSR